MKDPKRYDGPSASTGFGGGNARNRGGGPPPHQSWLQKVLGTGKKVGALVKIKGVIAGHQKSLNCTPTYHKNYLHTLTYYSFKFDIQ